MTSLAQSGQVLEVTPRYETLAHVIGPHPATRVPSSGGTGTGLRLRKKRNSNRNFTAGTDETLSLQLHVVRAKLFHF